MTGERKPALQVLAVSSAAVSKIGMQDQVEHSRLLSEQIAADSSNPPEEEQP